MTPVQVAKPASEEFQAAIRWYEQGRQGLGSEFYEAVVTAFELIGGYPEIGTMRPERLATRQLGLQRFPCKIVYRVREYDLYVVAVAHTSRRPGYWRGRL